MKKSLFIFLLITFICVLAFSACDTNINNNSTVDSNEDDGTDVCQHAEVVDAAVNATCTTDGKTKGKHCSLCGEILLAQIVIEAKGHTEIIDIAIPATCKDTGLTEGSHCSVCNTVLTAQTATPILEHNMTEATCMLPATCKRACGYMEGTASKHVIVNNICTGCEAKTIRTVEELMAIDLDGKYILMNDISLDEAEWIPLGTSTTPFSGFFDGNGYTISNLKITSQHNYFGLFGYNTGTIQSVGIETTIFSSYVRLSGAVYSGSLAGYNAGMIMNCYADAVNIILNTNPDLGVAVGYAGGLVGYNSGMVSYCYSSGTQVSISSLSRMSPTYAYSGGLVGLNNNGTIANSYSAINRVCGSYSGSNMNSGSYVGGLVGLSDSATIINCYRNSSQTFYSTISSTTKYESTNNEGASQELSILQAVTFHTDTLGWSTELWNFTEDTFPSLKTASRVTLVNADFHLELA